MDIEQLAAACGGLAWISEQLFEIEGSLAAGLADGPPLDARTQALLACSSRRYGQHAQWWRASLPDSPVLAGADRVRPPTQAWSRLIGYVEESAPAEAVTALYEVALPELIFVLGHLKDDLSPVSDGAFLRTVRMVSGDLAEERSEANEVWPTRNGPSGSEIEDLVIGFTDDYSEKRWPSLVPNP